jgi:hypothetical protein
LASPPSASCSSWRTPCCRRYSCSTPASATTGARTWWA